MSTAPLLADPGYAAEQLTVRDYISWSAISTYRTCPLRYYFRYVVGLSEKTVSSSLVFGGAIHTAFEHHFNELMAGSPAPDHDTLLAAFWESWRQREPETIRFAKGEDVTSVGQLADRVLAAFRGSELAQPEGRLVGVEEELRGELTPDVPELLTRIDLLMETDSELIVTDFKSSRSRWSAEQVDDAGEQLLLYGSLARELAPQKPLRLQFGVVTKAKQPTVERYVVNAAEHRVDRAKRTVELVWQGIESRTFYPAPSPMSCPGCPFREACRQW